MDEVRAHPYPSWYVRVQRSLWTKVAGVGVVSNQQRIDQRQGVSDHDADDKNLEEDNATGQWQIP